MSAYIVEDHVIDYVISAYEALSAPGDAELWFSKGEGEGYWKFGPANWDELGQEIVNENYASVNYRYSENDEPHVYKFRPHALADARVHAKLPIIIQAAKAISNIDYQSCEHPGWDKSLAKRALGEILSRIVARMPGYDAAEWGAPGHEAARLVRIA